MTPEDLDGIGLPMPDLRAVQFSLARALVLDQYDAGRPVVEEAGEPPYRLDMVDTGEPQHVPVILDDRCGSVDQHLGLGAGG